MSKFSSYDPASRGLLRVSALDGFSMRTARHSDLREAAGIAAEREGESLEKWLAVFERWQEDASGQSLLLVAALRQRVIGYGRAQYFVQPEEAPGNVAPQGWYLMGVVIHPAFRRRGVGLELTRARLALLAKQCSKVFYFVNERNLASIGLHRSVGFVELTRDFWFPKVQFDGGVGVLFECDLRDKAWPDIALEPTTRSPRNESEQFISNPNTL